MFTIFFIIIVFILVRIQLWSHLEVGFHAAVAIRVHAVARTFRWVNLDVVIRAVADNTSICDAFVLPFFEIFLRLMIVIVIKGCLRVQTTLRGNAYPRRH